MKQKQKWILPLLILISLMLMLVSPTPVRAAEIDNDGRLAAGETVEDDLLTSAEMVSIDGNVQGNLLAAGQTVTINGTIAGDAVIAASTIIIGEKASIEGNLIAASSTIVVAGQVGGSVFGASAAITLRDSAKIDGNIYYAGYSAEMDQGSVIDRDFLAAVYQAILNGTILRDVRIAGGAVEINGTIGRNAQINLGEEDTSNQDPSTMFKDMPFMSQPGVPATIQPGLRVAETAVIGGMLSYTASTDQSSNIKNEPAKGIAFATPLPNENRQYNDKPNRPDQNNNFFAKFLGWLWQTMREFITLLVLGLLAVWLIPNLVEKAIEQLSIKPLPSAGYGFVSLVVGYSGAFFIGLGLLIVGIIISIFTLGGLSNLVFSLGFSGLAFIFACFNFLVFFGSKIVVAGLLGRWVIKAIAPTSSPSFVWIMVVGIVLYRIPASLPFIGWIFVFAATLFGLGAIWLAYNEQRHPKTVEMI